MDERKLTPETWLAILASAYTLFDDAEARGFGTPPFALGVRARRDRPRRKGHRAMKRDALTAARNAVENSSRTPVSDAAILSILATGEGPGHLVRALFGDCAFETLDRIGATHGIARATIRNAYAVARRTHMAYNEALEEPLH